VHSEATGGDTGSDAGESQDRDELLAREVPLARFPRGAGPGTFLHDVLEHLDFTAADADGLLDELVVTQLDRHRIDAPDDVPLIDGLRLVLRTPLGPLAVGATLADVPLTDRLSELDFDLPLVGGYEAAGAVLRLDRVADVLDRYVGDLPILGDYTAALRELGPRPVRGFLTGSIDLVLRVPVEGRMRYFVADHKSNWHGDRGLKREDDRSTLAHYHPDALERTMVEHHYILQSLLYLVGLHRFLRWRLGDAYDYEQDIGGVLYLFLRGMVGAETPTDARGVPHGVFSMRPPAGLIDELDTLFATGEVRT
jgi:exodeoxyribonuclease V beta subunit